MIDFKEISKYKENNRIEAKRSAGGFPHSLWETYSSFANTIGGIILLGVEELADKSFRSVKLSDPQALVDEFWKGVLRDGAVSVNILKEEDVRIVEAEGNRIVVIEIPRAGRQERPVYIGTDCFSGSFRRNGDGDYHCSREEVLHMLRDRQEGPRDGSLLVHLGRDVFEAESIAAYRKRLSSYQSGRCFMELKEDEMLCRIGAAGIGSDGSLHPRTAGLLMFGRVKEILRELPNYYLEYQDNTAAGLGGAVITSDSGNWSGNLHDFYFLVYDRLTKDLHSSAGALKRAIKEALVNAVVHADYSDEYGLLIRKNERNVTISNPGGFRIDIAAAVRGGSSDPRNPVLAGMFSYIHIGKRSGSGLSSIHAILKEQGLAAPKLEEHFNPERTILSMGIPGQKDSMGGVKKAVLDCLTDHISCTAADILQITGLRPYQVRECLYELEDSDLIVGIGRGRVRNYHLKE